jgi:hypothetical protein
MMRKPEDLHKTRVAPTGSLDMQSVIEQQIRAAAFFVAAFCCHNKPAVIRGGKRNVLDKRIQK